MPIRTLGRKVRYGMVGGGPGAFIGAVHRKAAALDGAIQLVAGAFSTSPERSKVQGEELFLDSDRVYESYEQMIEKESQRPDGDRIDFISVVTPNDTHFPIAKAAIEAGFHVVCDKPMTLTVEEAETLCQLVKRHDRIFALTHNYTGYPMVKEAREFVRQGKLGDIRKVVVEYPQGWLATAVEEAGSKQASWRTDPAKAGVSSSMGDIGSHAENLAAYITGLEMSQICADITTFVPGRKLEDDGSILIRYTNGARGILYASQISIGEENSLRIRVYGTKASLDWQQEYPTDLVVKYPDKPREIYRLGNDYLSDVTRHHSRLPAGHPEAFIEAFANIYLNVARTIAAKITNTPPGPFDTDFPTVQDGAKGVWFIHKAVEAGVSEAKWIDMSYKPPQA